MVFLLVLFTVLTTTTTAPTTPPLSTDAPPASPPKLPPVSTQPPAVASISARGKFLQGDMKGCSSVIDDLNVMRCLPYVTGGGSLGTCCRGMSAMRDRSLDYCICAMANEAINASLKFYLDRALGLPTLCSLPEPKPAVHDCPGVPPINHSSKKSIRRIVLVILLCVLAASGGGYSYWWYRHGQRRSIVPEAMEEWVIKNGPWCCNPYIILNQPGAYKFDTVYMWVKAQFGGGPNIGDLNGIGQIGWSAYLNVPIQ